MRHGNKTHYLGRTASHRKATMANMACSLIEHKRITTTLAKAKALREYVEPLITKCKDDTTHSRRIVFSYLKNKESIKILFDEVSRRIADRPGGYTRILKVGPRKGDNAEMALVELVDYNELMTSESKPKRRRRKRGGSGGDAESSVSPQLESKATASVAAVANEPKAETKPAEEDIVADEVAAPVVDEVAAPVAEATDDSVVENTESNAEESTDTEEEDTNKEDKE